MNKTVLLATLFALFFSLTFGCKSPQKETPSTMNDSIIQNELIVQLEDGATPQQLENAFQRHQLKLVHAINQSMNLWLFSFDTGSIEFEKMRSVVKKSNLVKEAEFNKRLKPRSRG